MSSISNEPELLIQLARLELLQGVLPQESAERRSSLYDSFGAAEDRWVDKARNAYSAMSATNGFVASVGDELSCELDIRENAELYAAVGGFDVSEITHGLGAWWSPSAAWFQTGQILIATDGLRGLAFEDFEATSRLLLEAGARALANFFATVTSGGQRLLSSGGRLLWRRRARRELLFVTEIARVRGLLFRDGPDEDGHYLRGEPVDVAEIVDTVTRSRRA